MMNIKTPHYLLLALFLIFIVKDIYAQELPKILDPPLDFDKLEIKKLEKANQLIKSGIETWNQLIREYNPKNITNYKIDSLYHARAYPLMVNAVNNIQDGNMMKFEVYRKNCTSFWNKHKYDSPSGLENAKAYQKEATDYFAKAQMNMQAAENYKNEYGKAFNSFHEAISLEIIAVKKEGRALQLYRDWPVHYSYVYDDDIVKNLFPKDKKPTEAVVAVVEEKKDTVKKQVIAVVPEPEPEPYDSTVIYYQVQIGAHTAPLNSSYIKMNIYDGDMPIETLREEGWYKYVIGRYRTFDEANKLLKKVNVPKAFVVAYKNHKRVPIKEAESSQR
jgi:hypothetical protein